MFKVEFAVFICISIVWSMSAAQGNAPNTAGHDCDVLRVSFPNYYNAFWSSQGPDCCLWKSINCSILEFPGRVDRIRILDWSGTETLTTQFGQLPALEEIRFENTPFITGQLPPLVSNRSFDITISKTGITAVPVLPQRLSRLRLRNSPLTFTSSRINCTSMNLVELDLEAINYTPFGFPDLRDCTSLQILRLQSVDIGSTELPFYLGALPIKEIEFVSVSLRGPLPPLNSALEVLCVPYPRQSVGPEFDPRPCMYLFQNLNLNQLLVIIISIQVDNTSLSGDFLSVLATCCTNLRDIRANRNPLWNATIPGLLVELRNLSRLSLYDSAVSGTIPSFHQFTQLRQLYLGKSGLRGIVPLTWPPGLEELSLSANSWGSSIVFELQSTVNLLHVLTTGCPNMTRLALDGQRGFNGTIPQNIGNAWPRLIDLYLGGTNFEGQIPDSLGSAIKLQDLSFTDARRINGTVPSSLGNLQNLVKLELDGLPTISGGLPDTLGNLINLRELDVDRSPGLGNNGPIPEFFKNYTKVFDLSLRQSNFTGEIPVWLSRLQSLREIDIRNSAFVGCPEPFWFASTICLADSTSFANSSGCNITALCRIGLPVPDWVLNPPISAPEAAPVASPVVQESTSCTGNVCSLNCDTVGLNTSCIISGSVSVSNGSRLVIPTTGVVVSGNFTITSGSILQVSVEPGTGPKISVANCLTLDSATILDLTFSSSSNLSAINNTVLAEWDSRCSSVSSTVGITSNLDVCRDALVASTSQIDVSGRGQLSVVFTTAPDSSRSQCNPRGTPGSAESSGLLLPMPAVIGIAVAAAVVAVILVLLIIFRVRSLRKAAMPFEARRTGVTSDNL